MKDDKQHPVSVPGWSPIQVHSPGRRCLTSVILREPVCPSRYGLLYSSEIYYECTSIIITYSNNKDACGLATVLNIYT